MKVFSFCIVVFIIGVSVCSAQSEHVQLKVLSGNKLVVTDEPGKLENVFYEHLGARERELKDRISQSIGESMKVRTNQGLRALTVRLGSPNFSFVTVNSEVMFCINFSVNKVSFYVTTPDHLGIGKDRSEDPFISFSYSIKGLFKISQQGDAESIEFGYPYWSAQVTENDSKKLQSLGWSKWIDGDISNMVRDISHQYNVLSEAKDKFNYYIDKKILANKALQSEMLIDGNTALRVSVENDKTLVFKHDYSSAGILKRSTGTNASVINEKVNAQTSVPTSTKPSDVNKKAPVPNRPPKVPNSSGPADLKKGSAATKKSSLLKL